MIVTDASCGPVSQSVELIGLKREEGVAWVGSGVGVLLVTTVQLEIFSVGN